MLPSSHQQMTPSEDPRFAELLRPIKDLTANFNIPLSQFLDKYFLDLRDGMSSADLSSPLDSQSKVNFVEAGLFLQGTASVYSKKVEFLWQNVLQMLEFLAQRQSLLQDEMNEDGEEQKSARKSTKKKDLLFFSCSSGELKAVSMNHCGKSLLSGGNEQTTLNFIAITPCELIQREGKEGGAFHSRVNIYASSGEILGPKEDFRVNAQYCSLSGVIGQGIGAPNDLQNTSISFAAPQDSLISPVEEQSLHVEQQVLSPQDPPEQIQELEEEPIEPQPIEEDESNQTDRLRCAKRKAIKDTILSDQKSQRPSLAEIWESLKSSEGPETKGGKIRRCNLLKRGDPQDDECSLKKASSSSSSNLCKKTLSEYFNQSKRASHRPKRETIAHIPPELTKEAFDEEKRRRPLKRKILPAREAIPYHEEEEQQHEEEVMVMMHQDDNNNDDDWEDAPDPHDPLPHSDSYEEIVMRKVGNYVTQSQDYIGSTELAKRVAAWHEHIRPKLDAVETRGAFNIHSYGSKVIEAFPCNLGKNTLSFSAIVHDVEREEVSRYFLSCLMLANTSNLDLQSDGMNDLSLTLLSKKRHHEELMTSQEPILSAGSRKRVMPTQSATVDDQVHQEVMNELDALPD